MRSDTERDDRRDRGMRIGVAQVKQESNTFSTVPCGLEDFQQVGLYHGEDFLPRMKGVGEIGGLLEVVEEQGGEVELFPILRAVGHAGGRVERKALELFEEKLAVGLKRALPLDG